MQKTHGSFGDHAAVPPANNAPYSSPPTPHDWVRIQGAIHEYYVLQNLPLHDVRAMLQKNHGFKASDRMIKARLAKWEFSKNAKREDWGYLAILFDQRKKQRRPTIFDVRGHRKTVKDLHRFIRNQNISPEKFLAESLEIYRNKGQQIPQHIRAFTPDSEDVLFSPLSVESRKLGGSPSPQPTVSRTEGTYSFSPKSMTNSPNLLSYRDPALSQRDHFDHDCPYQSYASEPNRFSSNVSVVDTMSSSKSASPPSQENIRLYSCEKTRLELEACSNQLLKPVPLTSRIGHNDMRCWTIINRVASSPVSTDPMDLTEHSAGCDHPGTFPFPSLELFEPKQQEQRNILNDTTTHSMNLPSSMRNEGSWVWVSLCFLACMSLTRRDETFAQGVLNEAKMKFEKLLRARDPLILTAAGLMITILHQHDQGDIAIRILNCAREVANEVLQDPDDPIRTTITYLALGADGSGKLLKDAGFYPAHLKLVYERLKAEYSARHPYTIAAHHNYAWLLKFRGEPVEAEKHARESYEESKAYFGVMHMQTMTSLSITTGCIVEQKNTSRAQECVRLYREIIENATQILGIIHPYTLEAQRRLAHLLEDIPGQKIVALKLRRTIVLGHATMLGRSHPFTLGHKEDYLALLQELGKWEDQFGQPTKEQKEMADLFTKDLEEAWELVERFDSTLDDALDMDQGLGPAKTHGKTIDHEHEWTRSAMNNIISRSRSASPTSSNEYEAY